TRILPAAMAQPPSLLRLDPAGRVDDLGVPQLPERLALDQPDPLAGEAHLLADVPEAHGMAVAEAIAKRDDPPLPGIEDVQHRVADLLPEHRVLDRIQRALLVGLLEQVAQLGVLAHRGLEGDGLPA